MSKQKYLFSSFFIHLFISPVVSCLSTGKKISGAFCTVIFHEYLGSLNSSLDPETLYPLFPYPMPGPTRRLIPWAIVFSIVASISLSFFILHLFVASLDSSPFLTLSRSMTLPCMSLRMSVNSIRESCSPLTKSIRLVTAIVRLLILWSCPHQPLFRRLKGSNSSGFCDCSFSCFFLRTCS